MLRGHIRTHLGLVVMIHLLDASLLMRIHLGGSPPCRCDVSISIYSPPGLLLVELFACRGTSRSPAADRPRPHRHSAPGQLEWATAVRVTGRHGAASGGTPGPPDAWSLGPGRRQVTPPRLLMVVNSAAVWGHARGSVLSGPLRVLRGYYGVSGTSNLNRPSHGVT